MTLSKVPEEIWEQYRRMVISPPPRLPVDIMRRMDGLSFKDYPPEVKEAYEKNMAEPHQPEIDNRNDENDHEGANIVLTTNPEFTSLVTKGVL